MNVTDFQEVWQVDVGTEVYEATFEVLMQWIDEGSLLPQDKVRRGNLRWIEARRVPALMPFFNARESGTPPPVIHPTVSQPSVTASSENQEPAIIPSAVGFDQAPATAPPTATTAFFAESPLTAPDQFDPFPAKGGSANPYQTTPVNEVQPPPPSGLTVPLGITSEAASAPLPENPRTTNFAPTPTSFEPPAHGSAFTEPFTGAANDRGFEPAELPQGCTMHPESPAFFVCETCANVFCKLCPKSYGGTVRICPYCGAMCQRIEQKKTKDDEVTRIHSAISEGFGFGDFGKALAYPLKFKASLFFGAILFMFFTLGQSASAVGGLFMLSASLMCYMLSNMLYFGILTNVLENFSQGFTDRNFMPSFDEFSLWDDVVHPFFLSVAVYLVSFGLFILIAVGGVLYAVNSAASAFGSSPPISQSQREEVEQFAERMRERSRQNSDAANRQVAPGQDEEEEFRELNEFIQNQRREQLESGIGKSPETVENERSEMLAGFLKMALPLLLLAGAAFLWGIFYLPAACMVAGYTRSFVATMNPKIGFETIRILGADYFKILVMGLLVGIMSLIAGIVLGMIFFPFNLPGVGNLPAKAIGSLFGFYLSVVFTVVLGFALFKNSDKLQLYKG